MVQIRSSSMSARKVAADQQHKYREKQQQGLGKKKQQGRKERWDNNKGKE